MEGFYNIFSELSPQIQQECIETKTIILESKGIGLNCFSKNKFKWDFEELFNYQIVFPGFYKYLSPENVNFDSDKNEDKLTIISTGIGTLSDLSGLDGTLIRISLDLVSKVPNLIIPTQKGIYGVEEFNGKNEGLLIEDPILYFNEKIMVSDQIPQLIGFTDFYFFNGTVAPKKCKGDFYFN